MVVIMGRRKSLLAQALEADMRGKCSSAFARPGRAVQSS